MLTPPSTAINKATTTNVYVRRRASFTIHMIHLPISKAPIVAWCFRRLILVAPNAMTVQCCKTAEFQGMSCMGKSSVEQKLSGRQETYLDRALSGQAIP